MSPAPRFHTFNRILKDFFDTEASGGFIMIFAASLAMILANIPMTSEYYNAFIHTNIHIQIGDILLNEPLKLFTKDVLMVLFFMIVGLELKREMLEGFLSQKGQKILPALAAIGGIIVPAVIFYLLTLNAPDLKNGWAIPTATDIAFALGVLAIFGRSMPPAAKIFLLAIAIYDDLAAIIILALFYGNGINPVEFIPILCLIGVLYIMHRVQISYLTPYLIICGILAVFLHHAGLHTTIAGVVTAMFIPLRIRHSESKSPVGTLIHYLHPWVSYWILPLFAFVSSGIVFAGMTWNDVFSLMTVAIALSLFIGKQIGIFGVTYLCVKMGVAQKPENTSWTDIYIIAILAGIGFTMSLFIGLLAFDNPIIQSEIKLGVIAGSLMSAIWAVILIKINQKSDTDKAVIPTKVGIQ
jgi:Na+:H+ antiporter, NhaA family